MIFMRAFCNTHSDFHMEKSKQHLNFGSFKSCSKNSNESATDVKNVWNFTFIFPVAFQYGQNLIHLPYWAPLAVVSRALARKEKQSEFCINWGEKCNWGHCELLSKLSCWSGDKTLRKFTIFSLKLIWYSHSEIIKLKLSICYI